MLELHNFFLIQSVVKVEINFSASAFKKLVTKSFIRLFYSSQGHITHSFSPQASSLQAVTGDTKLRASDVPQSSSRLYPEHPWMVPVILCFILFLMSQAATHRGLFRATCNSQGEPRQEGPGDRIGQ